MNPTKKDLENTWGHSDVLEIVSILELLYENLLLCWEASLASHASTKVMKFGRKSALYHWERMIRPRKSAPNWLWFWKKIIIKKIQMQILVSIWQQNYPQMCFTLHVPHCVDDVWSGLYMQLLWLLLEPNVGADTKYDRSQLLPPVLSPKFATIIGEYTKVVVSKTVEGDPAEWDCHSSSGARTGDSTKGCGGRWPRRCHGEKNQTELWEWRLMHKLHGYFKKQTLFASRTLQALHNCHLPFSKNKDVASHNCGI